MAKYLIEASYTADGVKGLLKDGGSARREAATQLIEALGGKVEAMYFSFGSSDAYVAPLLRSSEIVTSVRGRR